MRMRGILNHRGAQRRAEENASKRGDSCRSAHLVPDKLFFVQLPFSIAPFSFAFSSVLLGASLWFKSSSHICSSSGFALGEVKLISQFSPDFLRFLCFLWLNPIFTLTRLNIDFVSAMPHYEASPPRAVLRRRAKFRDSQLNERVHLC